MLAPSLQLTPAEWEQLSAQIAPPPPKPDRSVLLAEKFRLARKLLEKEYEGIALYRPLPLAAQFHACNAEKRLADSSNQSGKTTTVAAESAYALGGCDPHDKYIKHEGNALLVGLDLDHVAMFWRKLTQPGAFSIIPDEHTGLYRAVRPDPSNQLRLDPYDEAYKEKWRDAPPLLSVPRNAVAWEDVKKGIPRMATIPQTGWKILCRSSEGKPPQGDHYQLVIFDEEMMNVEFFYEAIRGLMHKGEPAGKHPKLIWSATSQVVNPELANLRDRAAQGDPQVKQFCFYLRDNPYITEAGKREFAESLPEDQRLTRVEGIPAMQVRRIYQEYNPQGDSENGTGHGCEPFLVDPATFCRWIILDPGLVRCAVLFVAIDHAEQYLTIYDGFVTKGGAKDCALLVKQREDDRKFEGCVCDAIKGKERQSHITDITCASEYFKAFRAAGVQFRQLGPLNGFFPSCSDIAARTLALKRMMEVRGSGPFEGTCKLRVVRGSFPEMDKQIIRATTDPKNPNKRFKHAKVACDALDTCEYGAAFDPHYFAPDVLEPGESTSPAYHVFREKQVRQWRKAQSRRNPARY